METRDDLRKMCIRIIGRDLPLSLPEMLKQAAQECFMQHDVNSYRANIIRETFDRLNKTGVI